MLFFFGHVAYQFIKIKINNKIIPKQYLTKHDVNFKIVFIA